MVSRRAFIGSSLAAAGALSVPALASAQDRHVSRATAPTLSIHLANNTGSGTVYAYVTGFAVSNNALMLLRSDGHTPYFPASPSQTLSPLGADCAIPVGSGRTITVPQMYAARIWYSIGGKITFYLNPGPALVQPSVSNLSDPNIHLVWDFCEFTYNQTQLFVNVSAVDFVSVPCGLKLTQNTGPTLTVPGLPAGAVDKVAAGLQAQSSADGQGWNKLIFTSGGKNLRCLSPYQGMVINNSLFSGYFEPYVSQVYQHYSSSTLTVNCQNQFGNVTGRSSGGVFSFSGGGGSFAMPSTGDIFSCATGPFNSGGVSGAQLAVLPRLAAAFNRTTLLIDANQPNGENPANYYKHNPTNHYSRIVHATEGGGLGYAFPYDDVTPTGGVGQSGAVFSGDPKLLTVTIGSPH